MSLVKQVYLAAENWPTREQFGLATQLCDTTVSVPSNIAEGKGPTGPREFAHHLSIAHGSLCEVETQLLIAHELGYLDAQQLSEALDSAEEVGRLIRGLIRKLNA